MNQQDIAKYAGRLHSWLSLRRRSACRKLAADSSAGAVPHLVEALHADDAEVCSTAKAALDALKDARAVDALCALWARGREAQLGNILAERGYIAGQPIEVRVLSALQANQPAVAGERAAAVPWLVQALRDREAAIAWRAEATLRALKDAEAVDALCALWARGREAQLGDILAERGYIARQPIEVRVLSALQANQPAVAGESVASVACLVEACRDRDTGVAQRAAAALRALQSPETVDALCELAIADPAGGAAVIVKEVDYQPQSVSRRCVLFLLTGQHERYLDLDFDFQHLRAEYQAGTEELRQRIGDVVRESGDTRLIGLFRASRQRKLASELTEREAAIVIEVRARNQQWPEIFARLFHIPLPSVIAGLDALDKSDWRPQNEVEAALLDELFAVRSAIGNIPEKPPAPNVTLGPVLTRWCERGRSSEIRRQSPETLRKTVRQAAPRDAVAALAALVANGQDIADDIEAARTHPHWLVRLACLALCNLAPQFAFSAIPAEGDGGGMWIARLAPAIRDATLYRRRAVSLNPDQLAALQVALAREKTNRDGRWAWGQLIELLARHCLRDAIIVDEQMTDEVDDTAIEIEG